MICIFTVEFEPSLGSLDMRFANIFSQSVVCLLQWAFTEQKLLIFMSPIYPFFPLWMVLMV